ncbi:MAG: hypothetical protein GF421_02170 [Candidatus Aminicenantes bacterium]|nr:hypothetical protein [Candidatus Aminicenantes bacterium]
MKHKFPIVFLLILIISAPLSLLAQESLSIKNNITVAENEVQDNVFSFGGHIIIKGKIRESVVSVGGSITIEGEVGETVLAIGSDIHLKSSSLIRGDLVNIGGLLNKQSGTTILGDTIYFKTPQDVFIKGLFSTSRFFSFLFFFKLVTSVIWFILAVLLALILPRQISYASDQIKESFGPIIGIGFLSLVIFVALCLCSALLSLLIIGIPILLSLILIAVVFKVFGNVVLFLFVGKGLSKALGSQRPSLLLSIFLGFILITVLTTIPVFGVVLSFFLTVLAWGVTIRTKFGTTENWFQKT